MKMSHKRGAARVSAVWLIVLLVLLGVSSAFIYVANQEAKQANDLLAAEQVARKAADDRLQVEVDKGIALAQALGWRDANDPLSVSNLDSFQEALDSLKAVFPQIDSAASIEDVIQPLITAYRTQLQRVTTLEQERDTLTASVSQKEAANRAIESTLQAQIDTLTQEKADAEQTAADDKASLEQRLADMTEKFTQASDQINEEKVTIDTLQGDMERAELAATTRQLFLTGQLDQLRYQSEQPDGTLLAVSKTLNIGWVNRGSVDRVAEGMVFEVRTGNPNPGRHVTKAFAEVTVVEADRSRVRFFDQADDVDPPVTGDEIYNPVYEPGGERYAILAGRFSGLYNRAEVTMLLDEIGIKVQKEIDQTTNYLIVGGPLYQDENGEALEDPIQPSELLEYKDAQAYGCTIISINDLRKYFRR